MKRLCATVTALALSGGLALAQSSGGSTGGSTGGASSPGASSTGPTSPTGPAPGATDNPRAPATAGATPPSPADNSTTGRAPGVNPANSQDVSRRGNPQDLTLPRGQNPQDSKAPGTPQIYKPER